MRHGFRTQLTATISLIVLVTVAAISVLANVFTTIEFENHVQERQKNRARDIAGHLAQGYDRLTGEWDVEYVHGFAMNAATEGYIIRLYDQDGSIVWDAETHDLTMYSQIMAEIAARMKKKRPALTGGFAAHEYALAQNGENVGTVSIISYGPYFLSESDFGFLNAMNLVFPIVGGLSLLGSLAAGGLLARRLSRPIAETAHIASQIAEGNYKIRFEGKIKTRELHDLVSAVNHLAEALDRQETLRKRLATDMAHELRTPLTAVTSHLEMMLEGVWRPPEERLQSCFEEIGRITRLVADLEKLSEVENENLHPDKAPADLLELARLVVANFTSGSIKRGISLEVAGEPSTVPVDRDRICQMMTNLLSNAIKYTPAGGHVRVRVADTPENGSFSVEDDGLGISEEDLPLIFERFYRTDKSRCHKTGGAGIGLTIVKSIVAAHEGTVSAESRVEEGSRFTVTLPKDRRKPG
jgi:signal transduction histidine kinase